MQAFLRISASAIALWRLYRKEPSHAGRFLRTHSSVAYIREQSDVSCSLDRNCQLTLMISTGAGDTAGQDLGSFRHALLELSDILVVDLLYTVYAEHANLLARALGRTRTSFTFHINISFTRILERYFAVRGAPAGRRIHNFSLENGTELAL